MIEPPLRTQFSSRDELIDYVTELSPWLTERTVSPLRGGDSEARRRLAGIDPVRYGATRNDLGGAVTQLSPYIRHGVLALVEVRRAALEYSGDPHRIGKFIQELAWRDYWQRIYREHPEWIWRDIEPYKTGLQAAEYAAELPADIAEGRTGVACIDQFIAVLRATGYLHNHARMYLAAYVVHWRRIRWQAGARWFLHHLLDGDPASNNLSWQWIASTFSNKPYWFNLDNVRKYAGAEFDTSTARNRSLTGSYNDLARRLFPAWRAFSHE